MRRLGKGVLEMTTPNEFNEIWQNGKYRLGSTCQRLVPFLLQYIPEGSTINDYGSGTGRAEVELKKHDYRINMVDFAESALENEARALIGNRLTYTISPLESLPADFPVADWGICINVLMLVEPVKLDAINREMRRTCRNLIIEVYDWPDVRLGVDRTLTKQSAEWWAELMRQYWPHVESVPSPEHKRRYIIICREDKE
jgi:SAM-dependent methyltransferase